MKFIFVSFDAANGEVETIDFKDGVQNVDYQDLVRFNKYWKNIGTNDGQKFVLSAAEAYVDDKGLVKAVVIKSDSSEADLSRIAVITDTPGDKNWQKSGGAEGDRTDGMSYAKRYVTGPSFSMAEEKTGYFDRDYPIGTILVITEKENYIVGKYFHSAYYNNGNPDAMWVKGITPLKNIEDKDSEAGFLIGHGYAVKTLNEKSTLAYSGNAPELVPGETQIVDLLGDEYVSGYDTYLQKDKDLKGLVKVDKNTTFVDLRPINTDTIDDMGDLLDYDLSTVELRLLVNGNKSTDTFRRAYAVIVEKADGKPSVPETPTVEIHAMDNFVELPKVDNTVDGKTQETAFKYSVVPGKPTTLQAIPTVGAGTLSVGQWKVVSGRVVASFDAGNQVTVPGMVKDTTAILSYTVVNTDNTKLDKTTQPVTYYVQLVADKVDGGQTDPTETYKLTLTGSAFAIGGYSIQKADGASLDATVVPGAITYNVPKNEVVTITFAADAAIDNNTVGAAGASKTFKFGTVDVKLTDGQAAWKDTAVFTMTDNTTINLATGTAPATGVAQVSIKVAGGVKATWTKSGETTKYLGGADGNEVAVPAGGSLEITNIGNGQLVLKNAIASTTVTADGTDVFNDSTQKTVATINADVALYSATKVVTVNGTSATVKLTGASNGSIASADTANLVAIGATVDTLANTGADAFVKYTGVTAPTSAKATDVIPTAGFQVSGKDDITITEAIKVDIGTDAATAPAAKVGSTDLSNGDYVITGSNVVFSTGAAQILVQDDSEVGYGAGAASNTVASSAVKGHKFRAYTKVSFADTSLDSGSVKLWKKEINDYTTNIVASIEQATTADYGIKANTWIRVSGAATGQTTGDVIQATGVTIDPNYSVACTGATAPANAYLQVGSAAITLKQGH